MTGLIVDLIEKLDPKGRRPGFHDVGCRRLRGENFDEAVPSTHGIQVSSLPLAPQVFDAPVTLKIWDFGGQDIYHGTHALFLTSRAVFALVWTPKSKAEPFHTHGGFTFRNQPLAYWLAYVRTFGGALSPVLVIQSQCDRPEDECDPPLPPGALDGVGYKKGLHYSAKGDGTHPRGHEALKETLVDAVQWIRDSQGVAKIGPGRAAVKEPLEAKLAAGQRLISQGRWRERQQRLASASIASTAFAPVSPSISAIDDMSCAVTASWPKSSPATSDDDDDDWTKSCCASNRSKVCQDVCERRAGPRAMKYATECEDADPEKAARKLLEIANTVDAVQDSVFTSRRSTPRF